MVLTLWGPTAEGAGQELEDALAAAGGSGGVVAAISSCRVSSYNGISGGWLEWGGGAGQVDGRRGASVE